MQEEYKNFVLSNDYGMGGLIQENVQIIRINTVGSRFCKRALLQRKIKDENNFIIRAIKHQSLGKNMFDLKKKKLCEILFSKIFIRPINY